IAVFHQRNPGRAIGVVFDGDHRGLDIVLAALEVDDAVHPLVAAAPEARAGDALEVAAALLLEGLDQRLLRLPVAIGDLGEVAYRPTTAAGRRRIVVADTH